VKIGYRVQLTSKHKLFSSDYFNEADIGQTGVVTGVEEMFGQTVVDVQWDEPKDGILESSMNYDCLTLLEDLKEKVSFAELKEVFQTGYDKIGPFDKTDYALKWVLEHFDIYRKP